MNRDLGNLVRVLNTFERFDHQNQHDIIVDRRAITTRNSAPHRSVKSLAAAIAAPAQRGEVGPVPRGDRLFDGVNGWHDDHQSAGVCRVLDLPLVGIGEAHARNGLGMRCRPVLDNLGRKE